MAGQAVQSRRRSVFDTKVVRNEASKFSPEQLNDFRAAFQLFDKDDDGVITTKELLTVLRSLGQDPGSDELAAMLNSLDQDASGAIEFAEFIQVMAKLKIDAEQEEDYVEVFRVLDNDGDGSISMSDLREVTNHLNTDLSHEELEEMFSEADKDGDGQVSFEEFLKIVMARC